MKPLRSLALPLVTIAAGSLSLAGCGDSTPDEMPPVAQVEGEQETQANPDMEEPAQEEYQEEYQDETVYEGESEMGGTEPMDAALPMADAAPMIDESGNESGLE